MSDIRPGGEAMIPIGRRALGGLAASTLLVRTAPADDAPAPAPGFAFPIADLPFGQHSHWLQPWQAACVVRPAAAIASGVGIVLRQPTIGPAALAMLHRCGVRHLRTEIGWGLVDYETETTLAGQQTIETLLRQAKQAGLRPLILLNAHHGAPTPARLTTTRLVSPAEKGDSAIVVEAPDGLQEGFSGLQGFGPMAAVLVTHIDGFRVNLSRPLPHDLPSTTPVTFATLKYQPFGTPGTPRTNRTMAGWLHYVDLVADIAAAALGTRTGPDRGFDLEIWNELTFGAQFLDINFYYEPQIVAPSHGEIRIALVAATAAHIAAAPARYAGVRVSDGFGSTTPWPASTTEPEAITAISKHPYPPLRAYPRDEVRGQALDARARPTDFVPHYDSFFPEQIGTAIQTESILRDCGDQPNQVGRTTHGRLARVIGGRPAPVDVWITEMGAGAAAMKITEPAAIERFNTAELLRCLFFFLGIGVQRVYWFEAFSTAGGMGAGSLDAPTRPTPALRALQGMLARIGQYGGPLRALQLKVVADPASPVLFDGDAHGDGGAPAFLATDALVLLPIQRGPREYAIVFYIMTRDLRRPLPDSTITILVSGPGRLMHAKSYDPVQDSTLTIEIGAEQHDAQPLRLSVGDAPRLLLIDYAG